MSARLLLPLRGLAMTISFCYYQNMWNRISLIVKNFDWILFAAVMLLLCFGLVEIYSIALSQGAVDLLNFKKQLGFVALGVVALFIFASIDYLNLRSYSNYIYIVGVLLLVGVLFFGVTIRGTRGWYNLGPFTLQPVEFAKIILIVYLARYYSSVSIKISPLKHLIISGLGTGIFVVLVMQQPDFGSAMILFLVWAVLLFLTGIKKRYILSIFAIMIIIMLMGWFFFFVDYQKARIMTFLMPETNSLDYGYNITQAMIAVGSGRMIGQGIGFGTQSQLKFLPEAQNDFIFAVIAEELGFLGVTLVILFFAVFFFRLIKGVRSSPNDYGVYFLLGVIVLIFIEMFINIGMNIGILPVIGISLPFLSYGGSAIVSSLILVGIAESVIIRSKLKY